jgi:hypothetical protein
MLRALIWWAARYERYYFRHIGELPSDCWTSVRYEELCRHPEATVRRVLAFLGAEPLAPLDYAREIAPRAVPRLPEVEQHRGLIGRRLGRTLQHHGYQW